MELSLSKHFPPYVIYLYSGGFTLLKRQSSGSVLCENHKNASFPTLERECGIFFDTLSPDDEICVYLGAATPVLVPQAIYQKPGSQYVRLQYDLSENETVLEDLFDEYCLLFPYPVNRLSQLQKAVSHPISIHHITTAMANFLAYDVASEADRMFLHFDANQVQYVLFKDQQLQIISHFSFLTQEDILYHILNIYHQFGVNRNVCETLYVGRIADEKRIEKFLKGYLPKFQSLTAAFGQ